LVQILVPYVLPTNILFVHTIRVQIKPSSSIL
jgi:hypothetical protein